ncbi:radical SAM additional 4Fe4S-binding domain-containing protein [Tannerella sp. CAG:118]|nr:radical SAM additional 4Fe4S-binding domain-containing protein [Tannerella sp. CAG:118]
MVGTASPVMKKYIQHPLKWVLKNKWNSLNNKPICIDKKWYNVGQDPEQGNLNSNI